MPIEVVSENSEEDLARRQAMDKVRWALRDLAANLMVITRGAGKPWEIGRQAQQLVNELLAYRRDDYVCQSLSGDCLRRPKSKTPTP